MTNGQTTLTPDELAELQHQALRELDGRIAQTELQLVTLKAARAELVAGVRNADGSPGPEL